MKWFSENEQYILAECDKCKRVLKLPRTRCKATASGYSVNPAALCPCGVNSDQIGRGIQSGTMNKTELDNVIVKEVRPNTDDVRIKIRSLEQLILDTKSQNSDVRITAAKALGEVGDVQAITPLLELLNDDTIQVSTYTDYSNPNFPIEVTEKYYPVRKVAVEVLNKLNFEHNHDPEVIRKIAYTTVTLSRVERDLPETHYGDF